MKQITNKEYEEWQKYKAEKAKGHILQPDNVSIENEDDWPQMARFHAEWSKKFYDVIVPYIQQAI